MIELFFFLMSDVKAIPQILLQAYKLTCQQLPKKVIQILIN